jgi:type 1 glutamine amidotransferase
VLVVTETAGYRHSSIPVAVRLLEELGSETGQWEVADQADTAEQVAAWITAANLTRLHAVAFANTSGTLSFTPAGSAAFYEWIRTGGAFMGIHSASDTFHGDPLYLELLGAEFDTHGPGRTTVEAVVQDPGHPACAELPTSFAISDEIYEFKHWTRAGVHSLLSLHAHPQTGAPGDFPVSWTRHMGVGRAFYTSLGHFEDVFDDPRYRAHVRGGMRWALGLAPGDDTPGNPVR